MGTVNLRIRYRPVRIGWCIRENNFEDLRRAMRLSHVFRGGVFNPIFPPDLARSAGTIRAFRADVLVALAEDSQVIPITDNPEVPWPFYGEQFFETSRGRPLPHFLDVSFEIDAIAEELSRDRPIGLDDGEIPQALDEANHSLRSDGNKTIR